MASPVMFWMCVAVLVYVYAGYPILLRFLPKRDLSSRHEPTEEDLPTVSLVIAAHNEAAVIGEKIRNSLALDYPREKIEIWIASDGSTDGTNEILDRHRAEGVDANKITPRGGKTRAINLTVPLTRGEILVFSDANPMYRKDAIRKLVRHFGNPSVGGVSGDVRLLNQEVSFGRAESLYYRYERFIQLMESRFHSIVGVDGAMYAIRRELFVPPSENILLDDFVISMTVAAGGHRVLYDPEAIATESGTPDAGQEFRRKVRISSGAVQAIKQREGLPSLRQGKLLFSYVSHKLLRWLTPVFLLGLYFSNAFLLNRGGSYLLFFLVQNLVYGLALAGVRHRSTRMSWPIQIPFFFALQNIAYLVGATKGLVTVQHGMWERTGR